MRMWMVDPKILCTKHLLGEHFEIHCAVGNLKKDGKWVKNLTKKGYLEPQNFKSRHKELVKEMKRRGYNHDSPLPEFDESYRGKINIEKSLSDLLERCENRKRRIENENKKHC